MVGAVKKKKQGTVCTVPCSLPPRTAFHLFYDRRQQEPAIRTYSVGGLSFLRWGVEIDNYLSFIDINTVRITFVQRFRFPKLKDIYRPASNFLWQTLSCNIALGLVGCICVAT